MVNGEQAESLEVTTSNHESDSDSDYERIYLFKDGIFVLKE